MLKLIKAIGNIALKKKVPIIVLHHITFQCNLKCLYCSLPNIAPRYKEMSTSLIKKAMKEFSDAGTIGWSFSGGEPLLRPDIGELISYAKSIGLYANLVTNGYFVKSRINKIKKSDFIMISLDGPKEINDEIRGKGSFEKAIEAIKIAKKNKIRTYISAVISRDNIKNNCYGIRELFKLSKKLDCKINFQPIYFDQFNSSYISNLSPNSKDFLKVMKLIKNFKKNTNLIRTPIFHLKKIYNSNLQNENFKCYAGKLFCDLLPNGIVTPCYLKEKQGINGLKYGFVNAFRMLECVDNCTCSLDCYTGWNYLFSLNLSSMIIYLKRFIFNRLNVI